MPYKTAGEHEKLQKYKFLSTLYSFFRNLGLMNHKFEIRKAFFIKHKYFPGRLNPCTASRYAFKT